MTTGLHAEIPEDDVHGPYRRVFADEAARTGDSNTYTAADVTNKVKALQLDTLIEYVLTATTPVWTEVSGGTPATHAHSSHSGIGADDHHARDHKGRHVEGGADPFGSTDLLDAVIRRLRESGGPTDLLVGEVDDGEYLKRSGTGIVGDTGAGIGPISSLSLGSIATQSSVGTWSIVSGMSITPGAGTYTVLFWANMEILGANDYVDLAVFANGTQQTNAEARFLYDDYQASRGAAYLLQRTATVADGQDIDVRLQTNDSTGVRWRDRRIMLIKE